MKRHTSTETTIITGTATAPGRDHTTNEDSVSLVDDIPRETLNRKGRLYIVADGIGGHQKGDVASQIAVEVIHQSYYDDPDTNCAASLERAIKTANAEIHQQAQDPTYAGMGTTVIAAIVRGDELTVAHVGDSRAYLLRNGALQQLTNDHTWVAEKVAAGILTPEEAAHHKMRHVITRSLGDQSTVEVTLNAYQLHSGDRLLLCSDGVWEPLSDQTMVRRLNQKPEKATSTMVKQAHAHGYDDATALAIVYGPLRSGVLEQARQNLNTAIASPQQRTLIIGAGAILALILLACGLTRLLPGNATSTTTGTATPKPPPASTSERYCIAQKPASVYESPNRCQKVTGTSIPANEIIWVSRTTTYTNCENETGATTLIQVTYDDRHYWINPWRIGREDNGTCIPIDEWYSIFQTYEE
jgi:serine/threonine protein phosphatase PrpC